MLLTLRSVKFADSLCKKPPSSMDELHKRAKGYIQMEEMSRFRNEVRQAGHKRDKYEGSIKTDLHKYKHYTPVTANRTTILKEVFNLEVPIRLSLMKPPRSGSNATMYYRYHRGIDQNTKDYY
ncbi:hypothetical protein GmHk_19G055301 [Glycine max]|nr:hypothetical protein GmHk_19G055301 [Glycine max]